MLRRRRQYQLDMAPGRWGLAARTKLQIGSDQALQLAIAGCQRSVVGSKCHVRAAHGFESKLRAVVLKNSPFKFAGTGFFDRQGVRAQRFIELRNDE